MSTPTIPDHAGAGFRPDIEGLRGISILSVVLYHLDKDLLPGGFVGVDIFFVISGFVITKSILDEIERRGSFSLSKFWARRSRRLMPSACLVLLVTAIATHFLLSPLVHESVGQDIVSAALYFANWHFASEAVDYMASTRDPSPVLHFWSLAVEEQFYMVWPLLIAGIIWLARRTSAGLRKLLGGVAAGLLVVSFAACIVQMQIDRPIAFFGTHARIWQLLTGALIAIAPAVRPGAIGNYTNWLAALLIGLSFALLSNATPYPGWLALAPTLAAALLILFPSPSAFSVTRALESKPLTALGGISYVLYLWHWPVFLFGAEILGSHSLAANIALTLVAIALAVATHVLIENPIRYNSALAARPGFTLASSAAVIAVVAGASWFMGTTGKTIPILLADGTKIDFTEAKAARARPYVEKCHVGSLNPKPQLCEYANTASGRSVMLFGDSHALHWFPALEAAAKQADYKLLHRTKDACPPLEAHFWHTERGVPFKACDQWREAVVDEILTKRPEVVVMAAASWVRPIMSNGQMLPQGQQDEARIAAVQAITRRIASSVKHVYLIAGTPRFTEEPIRCLLRNPGREQACAWPLKSSLPAPRYPFVEQAALPANVTILDLTSELCPGGTCPGSLFGYPVMYDNGHLSPAVIEKLSAPFAAALKTVAATAK